jgi:hypothetical protein
MNKLVVLTDLGTFKAYRLEEDRVSSRPQLQAVDAFENLKADDRIGRWQVSDEAGQFKTGGQHAHLATQDGADGERHNIWLENERRSVKEIAARISELLGNGEFESCYLAASNEINREIVEHLSPEARRKIEKNITCNLVNAPKEEVLEHFK